MKKDVILEVKEEKCPVCGENPCVCKKLNSKDAMKKDLTVAEVSGPAFDEDEQTAGGAVDVGEVAPNARLRREVKPQVVKMEMDDKVLKAIAASTESVKKMVDKMESYEAVVKAAGPEVKNVIEDIKNIKKFIVDKVEKIQIVNGRKSLTNSRDPLKPVKKDADTEFYNFITGNKE